MRPLYRIATADHDVTGLIAGRLIGLALVDRADTANDTLTLTLDDRDAAFDLPPPALASLRLALGYETGGPVDMGLWTVNRTEFAAPPATLTLHARAADLDAGWKEARTQSYDNTTLGAILTAVAARRGAKPVIAPDLAAIPVAHIDQTAQSDHAFTRVLARQHGATVKVSAGRLIVAPRGRGRAASGAPIPPVILSPGQVTRWSAVRDATPAFSRVEAVWNDLRTGEPAIVSVGSGRPKRRLPGAYGTRADALTAARAALETGARAAGSARLTLPGDPRLLAETPVTLTGFRTGVDGNWVVASARHRLNGAGYVTEVELAPMR